MKRLFFLLLLMFKSAFCIMQIHEEDFIKSDDCGEIVLYHQDNGDFFVVKDTTISLLSKIALEPELRDLTNEELGIILRFTTKMTIYNKSALVVNIPLTTAVERIQTITQSNLSERVIRMLRSNLPTGSLLLLFKFLNGEYGIKLISRSAARR